jgi:hypothetical protein
MNTISGDVEGKLLRKISGCRTPLCWCDLGDTEYIARII